MLRRGMPPIHPGKVLKEMYMEPLNISVTDLADNLGVHRRTISLLINEHSGISAEMALRLGKVFETTPELWLNIQQQYDLWYAGQRIILKGIKRVVKARPAVIRARSEGSTIKGRGIKQKALPKAARH